MKTIILTAIVSCMALVSFAQPNNPYNQRGIDYASSLSMIGADISAGKVKEFTAATLNEYSAKIPLKTESNIDMAGQIVKTIKASGFNFSTFIDNSKLSADAKQDLKDIYYVSRGMTANDYKASLVTKVDGINKQNLSAGEKELLLSMVAIAYNNVATLQGRNGQQGQSNCTVLGPEGSGGINCTVAGAIAGGVIGFEICGPWCALGGAVIGGIVGSLS